MKEYIYIKIFLEKNNHFFKLGKN